MGFYTLCMSRTHAQLAHIFGAIWNRTFFAFSVGVDAGCIHRVAMSSPPRPMLPAPAATENILPARQDRAWLKFPFHFIPKAPMLRQAAGEALYMEMSPAQ